MGEIKFIFVLLIAVALGLCIWALLRLLKSNNPPATPPATPPTPQPPNPPSAPGVSLEDPWKFYAKMSVDGVNGVDNLGNLYVGGEPVNEPKWSSMDASLMDSKFSFRGPYSGSSWGQILQTQLDKRATVISNLVAPRSCLLVEWPAVVILTGDCSLEGLVVRRGGTVLLAPGFSQERQKATAASGASMKLSLQFGICESGGLIQCGYASSEQDGAARLPPDLRLLIQFVDAPQGFMKSGAACSQYSYKVHMPGVTTLPDDPRTASGPVPQCESDMSMNMLGGCVTNVIGAKAFGCLFNGNLHLAGYVPHDAQYKLWSASSGGKSSNASYGEKLQLDGTTTPRSSYATCWTSCQGAVLRGATALKTVDDVSSWREGDKVVITCHSEAWVLEGSHMDYRQCKYGSREGAGYACPEPVIDFYVDGEGVPGGGFGVEVATISEVTTAGIKLKNALQLDHARGDTSSFRAADGSSTVQVTTPVHVGLLTRNIQICGRDSSPVEPGPVGFEPKISSQFYDTSQNLSDEESSRRMQLMPMGRMNRGSMKHAPLKSGDPSVPDPSTWKGQMGAVTCDFADANPTPSDTVGSYMYFANPSQPNKPLGLFLHDSSRKKECGGVGPQAKGSSLLGDDGQDGLGYILGATLKFQYGCGVVLDGVELYRMGIPANTGSLGQYSIHFHCAGWGPAFEGYTAGAAKRHLRVSNSVNWRSYSRWCVLHGTNLADISNNVFCVCMGNGVFTEDGVEHHNNIEHNLMVLNVQTGRTKLAADHGLDQNPGGVVGNFGPDGASSASIWLTNTCNYVYRNVLCCNPAYGVGIWAVALNPRSKAAPATLCVGSKDLGLPGLVGNSLAAWDPAKNTHIFLPASSAQGSVSSRFTSFQGQTEATGNIKNLGLIGGSRPGVHLGSIQSCPYLAENVVYSMCQFYIETSDETVPWSAGNAGLFVAERQFIPINGNTSGSFLLNNAVGLYPEAAGTSVALAGAYVPRVFSQNLGYSMQGLCISPAFGGFIWTQSGNSVLVGNCVLGGDYWSNPSSLKNSTQGGNMGNYAVVLIDMVTNAAISGSSNNDAVHKNLCKGALVSGPKTMLGIQTCTGSSTKVPPRQGDAFPDGVACEASNDNDSAAWVAFADGIAEGDISGLLDLWLGGGYAANANSSNHMPLRGVREDMTCFPGSPAPSPDSLNYVFLYDHDHPEKSKKFSTNADQNKMVPKPWSPTSRTGVPCLSCNGDRLDEKFKEIYPVLSVDYVEQRWSAVCSCVKVLPMEPT